MQRLAVLALLAAVSAPAFAQQTFHGDNARTGVYRSPGPTQAPAVQWTFKAAGPIVTSPAVADGVVYIGSLSGHLYAIDQADRQGEVELQVEHADRVVAGGRRWHGVLRVVGGIAGGARRGDGQPGGCSRSSTSGSSRRRACTGMHRPAQTIPDAWDVFTSSPAVANGKVYFGSGDGNVYAVDARSGVLQWKFATDGRRARFAGRDERRRLHRQLGQLPLCDRRRDRPAEVGVPGRRGPGHPQSGRLPVVPRGGGRNGVRRHAAMRTSTRSTPQRAARNGTTRPASRG